MASLVGPRRARAVHVLLSSVLIVGSVVMMSAAPVTAQEVVTNDTVIQMVRAGLSEGVILAKIRSSQTKFDTRTDALIALKQAGVAENVMAAILGGGAPPARAAAPPAASAPAGAVVVVPPTASQRGKGPVFHVTGGKQVELIAASGGIETSSMPYNRKTELVLAGNKATYRTAERQPVFLSTTEPAEMPLVRLDPGKNDRNLKFASSVRTPYAGATSQRGMRSEIGSMSTPSGTSRDTSGFVPGRRCRLASTGSSSPGALGSGRAAPCTTSGWTSASRRAHRRRGPPTVALPDSIST
jgi:hypothetical protein